MMKFIFNVDDVRYIKISYKDFLGETRSIKAAIKNINNREITACSKFEENLEIKTPQEIVLNIVCKEGLYRTKTILKSVEGDEPYLFFFLDTPQGFEYQQNREYFRVPIDIDCTYSVIQNDKLIKYKAKTVNLSANGICISISDLIITENNACISFFALSKDIETKVKYIRSEKINDKYLVSFSFIDLLESDRDLISQICIKKQLEQKRSSLF